MFSKRKFIYYKYSLIIIFAFSLLTIAVYFISKNSGKADVLTKASPLSIVS